MGFWEIVNYSGILSSPINNNWQTLSINYATLWTINCCYVKIEYVQDGLHNNILIWCTNWKNSGIIIFPYLCRRILCPKKIVTFIAFSSLLHFLIQWVYKNIQTGHLLSLEEVQLGRRFLPAVLLKYLAIWAIYQPSGHWKSNTSMRVII